MPILHEERLLDRNLTLDLVVNAVYFQDEYLISLMRRSFISSDELYKEFSKDEILNRLASDKQISMDEAKSIFKSFMDRYYQ